jgi:hypothetical protein
MKCLKFKHSRSDTKDNTRRYKGPHRALRCEVLDNSSELRLPADFLILRWVAIGPHKLAAALGNEVTQDDGRASLSSVAKTSPGCRGLFHPCGD